MGKERISGNNSSDLQSPHSSFPFSFRQRSPQVPGMSVVSREGVVRCDPRFLGPSGTPSAGRLERGPTRTQRSRRLHSRLSPVSDPSSSVPLSDPVGFPSSSTVPFVCLCKVSPSLCPLVCLIRQHGCLLFTLYGVCLCRTSVP